MDFILLALEKKINLFLIQQHGKKTVIYEINLWLVFQQKINSNFLLNA